MKTDSINADSPADDMDPVPQFAEYLNHFSDNHPPIEKAAGHAVQFHSIHNDIHTCFMSFLTQKVTATWRAGPGSPIDTYLRTIS